MRKIIIGILGTLAAIIVALVALVGAVIAYNNHEIEASRERIQAHEIELQAPRLERQFSGSLYLKGRVWSHSEEYTLTDLDVRIRMRDCAQPSEDGSCVIIKETTVRMWTRVPPGQARDFEEYTTLDWSDIAPDLREWAYEIIEIRGEKKES